MGHYASEMEGFSEYLNSQEYKDALERDRKRQGRIDRLVMEALRLLNKGKDKAKSEDGGNRGT